MNNNNDSGHNKLAMWIAIGLALGAIISVVIGFSTNDIAVWLAVGVGCGMAFGAAIGGLLDRRQNKR